MAVVGRENSRRVVALQTELADFNVAMQRRATAKLLRERILCSHFYDLSILERRVNLRHYCSGFHGPLII